MSLTTTLILLMVFGTIAYLIARAKENAREEKFRKRRELDEMNRLTEERRMRREWHDKNVTGSYAGPTLVKAKPASRTSDVGGRRRPDTTTTRYRSDDERDPLVDYINPLNPLSPISPLNPLNYDDDIHHTHHQHNSVVDNGGFAGDGGSSGGGGASFSDTQDWPSTHHSHDTSSHDTSSSYDNGSSYDSGSCDSGGDSGGGDCGGSSSSD